MLWHISERVHPLHGTQFRPLPWLGNAHLQTVLSQCLSGPRLAHPTREHQLTLPDGDRLVLHDSVPFGWSPGDRTALLVHGLCGCHRSAILQRVGRMLLRQRLRVVRLDLRGAGRGAALSRRAYHAGISEDVRAAALEVVRWAPTSPLTLVGFSLGGNVVLKLAGEAGDDPLPGLERVAAVGPPIDLVRCTDLLAQPRNRFYENYFLLRLVAQVRQRERLIPDLPRTRFPLRLRLRHFDDLFTAPQWGFADALDYYRRASSLPFIPRIKVPTLILTAHDDPFIAVQPFLELAPPPHIEVQVQERGGHLGFLGPDGAGGIRWAERRVAEWVARPQLGGTKEGRKASPAT
jgi:predicted alpha/beta-fold hydrolase